MKYRKLLVTGILVITLTGCSHGSNESGSTALGAVIGALVGTQFGSGDGRVFSTLLGAMAGGVIGNHVGRTMDAEDAQRMSNTFESAPSNQTVGWQNPDTRYQHQVVTQPATYPLQNDGQPCREFTHTATIGGRPEQVYGTACRQADGSWKVAQ